MIQLILKRLFTYIPVLLVVVIITFLMVHAAPGGPFDAERVASPEIIEKLNEAYNLDKPIHVQIYNYLFNAIQGDFGPSFKYPGRSVTELIMSGLPTTIELAIYSILFAIFWFITSILLILIKDLNINSVYEFFLMFLWVVSNIYFISVSIFKTFKN